MTQYNFDIEGTDTGDDLVLAMDSFRDSIWSRHKGSVAPTYAVAGMEWLDDAVTNKWVGKIYDGAAWAIQFYYDVVNDLIWVPYVPELQRFPLAGGTGDVLTLTPLFLMTAFVDTDVVTFEASANNTTAATLNISALGAKAIRKMVAGADVAVASGDILDGGRYILNYDAAANSGNGAWILFNPTPVSGISEKFLHPLAGGTADALTLTPALPLAAYADLDIITFEAASNNTTAVTLNVSALGVKAIRKMSAGTDVALVAGDLLDGVRYYLNYDAAANGAAGAWILTNPSKPTTLSTTTLTSVTGAFSGAVSTGALTVTGTIVASGNITGNSDETLKEDIRQMAPPLNDIHRIRGVRFTTKATGIPNIGFIAQEIEAVYPELVETDEAGLKSVAYGNLVAVLWEAVKELSAAGTRK